jgi:hypothetical protein
VVSLVRGQHVGLQRPWESQQRGMIRALRSVHGFRPAIRTRSFLAAPLTRSLSLLDQFNGPA